LFVNETFIELEETFLIVKNEVTLRKSISKIEAGINDDVTQGIPETKYSGKDPAPGEVNVLKLSDDIIFSF